METEEEILERELARADTAKQILNNPEFQRVFTEYREELFKSLSRTEWDETNRREEIYRQLKSLNTVEAKFTRALQTGKLAKEKLSLIEKAKKLIGN